MKNTNTIQSALARASFVMALALWIPAVVVAQSTSDAPKPNAVTLSAQGKCEYSEDGVTFVKLEQGHVFDQGATVRTGDGARADLFFRRTGTTVRLQQNTEIKLETMSVTMNSGAPAVHTLLDLRAGRIFTAVRSEIAGSTFEIKNAAGRSVLEGSGVGRYIITADGTHVVAKGSAIPLKVINESGVTIIAAGQQFSRKDGKMIPLSTNLWVKDLIQLDELHAAADGYATGESPPKP